MIMYKIDVLQALKSAGYSTYKLRKDKILGEATIQQIRDGKPISWDVLDWVCSVLDMQPGDILKFEQGEELGSSVL